MIQHFTVPGTDRKVPSVQYQLSQMQQVAVMALDFTVDKVEFGTQKVPGGICTTQPIGKLSEMSLIMGQQIMNSLVIDNWDFSAYPDPEVLLLDLQRHSPAARKSLQLLSVKEAREITQSTSLWENEAGIDRVAALIEAMAAAGGNKIVITALPNMVDYIKEHLPGYQVVAIDYKEPNYPDYISLLIVW